MTIANKDIIGCFPLLASVLGDKYGVQIWIGGDQAKTDGNIIYLPAMPLNLDINAIEAARGYVDHEAAHIRYTDFEALRCSGMDKLELWLFNAIEDWRVEKKMAETFPGCGDNLRRLIIRMFGEPTEAEHKSSASVILGYVLYTVRSWAVPEIANVQQDAGKELEAGFPNLRQKLDELLSEVRQICTSTADAIGYARIIAKLVRPTLGQQGHMNQGKKPQEKSKIDVKAGDNSVARSSSVPGNDRVPAEIRDKEARTARGDEEQPEEHKRASDSSVEEWEAALPQNLGEILSTILEANSDSGNSDAICVAKVGNKEIEPFGHEEKIEALRSSVAMRQKLSGLLLSRTLKKEGLGRRGKLDSSGLHRICVGNARIFRRNEEKPGFDTAIHILLDCSSSMCGTSISTARKACFALLAALSGIRGINLALTAFPAREGTDTVFPVIRHGVKRIAMPSFDAFGETPLGPALWWTLANMLPLKEKRKIILIITDGVPTSVKAAQIAISECEKRGIGLMGIGIQSTAIGYLLPNASKTIWLMDELASAIFDLMSQTLVNGDGYDPR